MKKLNILYKIMIIFLIIDTILVAACFAQEKTDNTVIVRGVSFNQVCQQIVDTNTPIKQRDDQTQSVLAEYSVTSSYGIQMFVRVKDSVAYISGKFCGFFGNTITFRGMKGSLMREGYDYLKAFAEKLNGQISYAKL